MYPQTLVGTLTKKSPLELVDDFHTVICSESMTEQYSLFDLMTIVVISLGFVLKPIDKPYLLGFH